jgi:cytochrome P450
MPESSVIKTPFQMTSVDPPEHTVKRRAASELVHRKRLEAADPLMQRITNELIDGFIEQGEIEFRSAFANPMAVTTICELAGFPREDRPKYLSWNRNSTGHGRRYLTDEQLAAQQADKPDQAEYCRQIILDRYENPRDDFLSWFIADQVERDGALNLPYLVTEVNLILVAGNETTSRLLANAMLLLLRNPDELAKVLADRTLVESAIEETLRFESPTQWTSRYCVKDTEIGGVPIPAGSFVMLLYGSANRDETWDDPDQFRVDRQDIKKHQMAFGGGPHLCLGKGIARLEGRLALEILLDRLQNVRLAPGKNDFRNIDNFQKRVAEELYIQFDPGPKVLA